MKRKTSWAECFKVQQIQKKVHFFVEHDNVLFILDSFDSSNHPCKMFDDINNVQHRQRMRKHNAAAAQLIFCENNGGSIEELLLGRTKPRR